MLDNDDLHKLTWWCLYNVHADYGLLGPREYYDLPDYGIRVVTGGAHANPLKTSLMPEELIMDVMIMGQTSDWVLNGYIYATRSAGKVIKNEIAKATFAMQGNLRSPDLRSLAALLKLQGVLKGSYD